MNMEREIDGQRRDGIDGQRREDIAALRRRFAEAKARRAPWESLWQDCYDFALPTRAGTGPNNAERLYDGTAPDAVDQLAAALLAQLTPPWSRWLGLAPGSAVPDAARGELAAILDSASATLQAEFDRSNLAVEIHQCFLDLVTAGTACLSFEEAGLGEPSAFRFAAVPLNEAVLEEGAQGRLDVTFRRSEPNLAQLRARFPGANLDTDLLARAEREPDARFAVLELVEPHQHDFRYVALLEEGDEDAAVLAQGRFPHSPFINFRWQKAPGEVWGRSPVMKALPDIRTANKVVELVLKNASIAVTGIWQADDDGVLNPANIKLVPGAIIPKAPGSSGLTPLQAPGRFDVSQLVLDDLRARIRSALLTDRLTQADSPAMTATEVLARGDAVARLLGATFGRLQGELLTPLARRGWSILRRQGLVPDLALDGREVQLQHLSPLARAQAQANVQPTLLWLQQVQALGPDGAACVDAAAAARWLGHALGVPGELLREAHEPVSGEPLTNQGESQ